MAKIKITAHVTADSAGTAHDAIDAMDRHLRSRSGAVHDARIRFEDDTALLWSSPPSFDDCEAAGLDGTARGGRVHTWEDVARAALAKLAQLTPADADVFERVMIAMQPAEEIGGPDGAEYVTLMTRIANEANARARRYTERHTCSVCGAMRVEIDDTQRCTDCRDAEDQAGITDEQIRELWRARLISSNERNVAIRTYRGGMGETARREARARCARILASIGSVP